MPWLTLLRMILALAVRLAALVREKRLMKAGAAHAMREVLIEQQSQVAAAVAARRIVRATLAGDPSVIDEDDGYRRD